MRIEQTSADLLGRMNQSQRAKKHNAGDFASVFSLVQSEQMEKAAEKESNPRNPLGIPDEEYRWYFIGLRYDADHVAYFPPHDAPVEQQRAWYEAVKGLSHLEMQLFMLDLSSALRGEKDYLSYDEMTEKIQKLGYHGVLEAVYKWEKQVEHDSAGVVDEQSLQIIKRHVHLCENLLDEWLKGEKKEDK
mgnify:FL=1